MSELAAQLLRMALGHSAAERAELACSLIEGLDEADDESVQAAWDAEIVRRMEDLNSGKVKLVSLAEARRRLSSSLD
jgi:putative addiction module component (TIGR02574 family)